MLVYAVFLVLFALSGAVLSYLAKSDGKLQRMLGTGFVVGRGRKFLHHIHHSQILILIVCQVKLVNLMAALLGLPGTRLGIEDCNVECFLQAPHFKAIFVVFGFKLLSCANTY